jgi:hypothetical protein
MALVSNDIVDYRYNPFTDTFSPYGYGYSGNPVEVKTIPSTSPYWVYLDEIPQKDSPSTVSIAETSPGTTVFTEVSKTTVPAAGQYRVIYGAEPDSTSGSVGQGIIEFNSADAGKAIDISYYGLGSIIQRQFFRPSKNNGRLCRLFDYDSFPTQQTYTDLYDEIIGYIGNIDTDSLTISNTGGVYLHCHGACKATTMYDVQGMGIDTSQKKILVYLINVATEVSTTAAFYGDGVTGSSISKLFISI